MWNPKSLSQQPFSWGHLWDFAVVQRGVGYYWHLLLHQRSDPPPSSPPQLGVLHSSGPQFLSHSVNQINPPLTTVCANKEQCADENLSQTCKPYFFKWTKFQTALIKTNKQKAQLQPFYSLLSKMKFNIIVNFHVKNWHDSYTIYLNTFTQQRDEVLFHMQVLLNNSICRCVAEIYKLNRCWFFTCPARMSSSCVMGVAQHFSAMVCSTFFSSSFFSVGISPPCCTNSCTSREFTCTHTIN